jgi:hypothetical protein
MLSCRLDAATEEGPRSVYQMPGQWYSGEATADVEGRYSLGGLTLETYCIEARSPEGMDLAPAILRGVNAPKEGDVQLQDLTLYKGGVLVGKVLGADGKPVEGAEASLTVPLGRHGTALSAKSDARGAFEFRGLASGRYAITVRPPVGSAACEKLFEGVAVVGGLSIEQRFSLPLGACVSGTVTAPDGRPVAGASVWARYGYYSRGPAATDAQGRFVLPGLSPPLQPGPRRHDGPQNALLASPPKDMPCLMQSTAPLPDVPLGGSATVDIRMQPGVAIAGRVTGPDGKPVAGCQLSAGQHPNPSTLLTFSTTRTGDDGRYTLINLPVGKLFLTAMPPQGSGLLVRQTSEQAFEGGKTTTVDIALEAGATLVGKVVTSKGQPVFGAQVLLQPRGGWSYGSQRAALTGPGGAFRIEAVAPGGYDVQCVPSDPGLRAQPTELKVEGKGEHKAEIILYATGSVVGTARDAAGKPLGQGMAWVSLQSGVGPQMRMAGAGHPDDQGSFRIPGLAPGKYTVAVSIGQRGQARGLVPPAPSELIVEEGKETKLDITVPAKDTGTRKPTDF